MDPLRDTPLKRFGALWIGLFIILSFGIATLFLAPAFMKPVEDEALQAEYDTRLKVKADVDAAQAEQVAPKKAFDLTAKQLLSTPAAKTAIVVPGSPTDLKANSN